MSIFDIINKNISKFTGRVSGNETTFSTPILTPEERATPFGDLIKKNLDKFTSTFGQVRQTPLTIEPDEVSRRITSGIEKAKVSTGVLKIAGVIGQSIARSFAAIGAAKDALIRGKDPFKAEVIPETKIQQKIFGTEEAFGFESIGREVADITGKGQEISPRIAIALGVVFAGLDAIPITAGKSKAVYKAIASSNKVDDIFKMVKTIFKGSDEDVKALAIGLTDVSDVKAVEQIITKVKRTPVVKPITPELIPKIIKVGGKERKFITSAKKIIPEADTRIAGQYIPRATDVLAIKARNLIKDNIVLAEKIALTKSDDTAVAIASELLKKYSDDAAKATDIGTANALYDKAAEVANTLAPKLTEQGRSIQAASILGRLTPEGQIRFAAREIQRFNELNPLKKIPELTGVQAKYISDEMKLINEMTDGVERAMRFQKLQNFIKDLVPSPLIKKVIAVWKAGLLTGIKTQGLNLFSNISHGITEVIKDVPAAIVDNVAKLFTGKRAKTVTIRKAFSGIKEGAIKGVRYFVTGFDERNIAAKLDYKRVNFGKGKVAGIFKAYTDTVFRFLGAADQPFYYAALSRSLMDQALAKGMTKGLKGKELVKYAYKIVDAPTEEMIRYGVADATTAVFQNQTKLGEAAAAIQKIPGIGELILPFGRTPSSVAMQIINYSPVGIAKTIITNIGKGKFDQRLFSQGIGRGLTGTAVIVIGMELAKKGMIALDYPQGDEREQELQKAEGVKNNAIKINGKWRTPIVLGPAGNLLLIGGHFQNAIETEGSPTEALSKGAWGSMSSFLEQTFLTGIKSSVNAITDPERYAKTYLPNLVASFVPTIVSDVARATDPKERRSEGIIQRIKARIPILRKDIEPQVDILGRERERVGNPLEVLIDPSRPSPEKETPVTQELRRLMNEGFRVSPTALGNRQGYKALTQKENTFLWKYTGQILNEKLIALFNNEIYQNSSDDEKADIVEDYVNSAKLIARVGMTMKLTQDLEGEELSKKLKELKDGGFLIRSVYNKWIELR